MSVTGPDGTITEQKTYDSFGNVLTQTDALGNQTRYQYDVSGRMISQIRELYAGGNAKQLDCVCKMEF